MEILPRAALAQQHQQQSDPQTWEETTEPPYRLEAAHREEGSF